MLCCCYHARLTSSGWRPARDAQVGDPPVILCVVDQCCRVDHAKFPIDCLYASACTTSACLSACPCKRSELAGAIVVILTRECAFLFVWDSVCGQAYDNNAPTTMPNYGDTVRAGLSPFSHVQFDSYMFLFARNLYLYTHQERFLLIDSQLRALPP